MENTKETTNQSQVGQKLFDFFTNQLPQAIKTSSLQKTNNFKIKIQQQGKEEKPNQQNEVNINNDENEFQNENMQNKNRTTIENQQLDLKQNEQEELKVGQQVQLKENEQVNIPQSNNSVVLQQKTAIPDQEENEFGSSQTQQLQIPANQNIQSLKENSNNINCETVIKDSLPSQNTKKDRISNENVNSNIINNEIANKVTISNQDVKNDNITGENMKNNNNYNKKENVISDNQNIENLNNEKLNKENESKNNANDDHIENNQSNDILDNTGNNKNDNNNDIKNTNTELIEKQYNQQANIDQIQIKTFDFERKKQSPQKSVENQRPPVSSKTFAQVMQDSSNQIIKQTKESMNLFKEKITNKKTESINESQERDGAEDKYQRDNQMKHRKQNSKVNQSQDSQQKSISFKIQTGQPGQSKGKQGANQLNLKQLKELETQKMKKLKLEIQKKRNLELQLLQVNRELQSLKQNDFYDQVATEQNQSFNSQSSHKSKKHHQDSNTASIQVSSRKQDNQIKRMIQISDNKEAKEKALNLVKELNQEKKTRKLKQEEKRTVDIENYRAYHEETKKNNDEFFGNIKVQRKNQMIEQQRKKNYSKVVEKQKQISNLELLKQLKLKRYNQASSYEYYKASLENNQQKLDFANKIPELDQKKQELAQKRNLNNPESASSHLSKQDQQSNGQPQSSDPLNSYDIEQQKSYTYDRKKIKMESIFTKKIIEEDKKRVEDKEKDKQQKLSLCNKRKEYGQFVKDRHKPKQEIKVNYLYKKPGQFEKNQGKIEGFLKKLTEERQQIKKLIEQEQDNEESEAINQNDGDDEKQYQQQYFQHQEQKSEQLKQQQELEEPTQDLKEEKVGPDSNKYDENQRPWKINNKLFLNYPNNLKARIPK